MQYAIPNFATEKETDMILNQKIILTFLSFASASIPLQAGIVRGSVFDKTTKEPLIGATIRVNSSPIATTTDINGSYSLKIKDGSHSITVSYIGYADTSIVANIGPDEELAVLDISLSPDATSLSEVTVTAVARRDTEVAMIEEERQSDVVQTCVSAQQIAKTQDKDASEVIRRVPGISIIDDKFVMVRGLSQRYNNVWLNGSAVPSSEADSRAFSFDIIPSSQLDNIVITRVRDNDSQLGAITIRHELSGDPIGSPDYFDAAVQSQRTSCPFDSGI